MNEDDSKTKLILEPSPLDSDLIMKRKSKEYDKVIRKLSFNENSKPANKNDEEPVKKELPPLEKLTNPIPPTTDSLPPLRKVRGPYSPPPLLDVSEKTLSNRNNNTEEEEEAMTPTSPHLDASSLSSSFNQNDIHLIPITYCQKLTKLSHIICPLKSSIMAYEMQNKNDILPIYLVQKKELLERYDSLIEKSRKLFSQNISHYFFQIEKKLIDIFNQCPDIDTEGKLFEKFNELNKINKDIRSFYRDIWYCSKIILSSPPNITVMIQRLHFYVRLDLESIIIKMRKIQFSYNDDIMSDYLLFINDIFQLQSEYPCAIGKDTCSLCNNALKQPYIVDKLMNFNNNYYIENPPKSICVFELLNDRYKCLMSNKTSILSPQEENENENIIMKFISSISGYINQCILHFIYTENGYNNFHHCNKRFYDIDDDDEIDYKELLVNYYYIILRKQYNRILPPTITDFSIIDWQIAMGKFQQFWRKTREWSLDNIQYSIKCLETALKKISTLTSDPNTCLMLSNTSLHIFKHFNNQLIRIYQHESLIVMCNVLLSMIELSKLCDKIVSNINLISDKENYHIINDIKEIFIHNKWNFEVYIGELTEKIRIKNYEMISHILDNTMKQKSYILKTTPLNMSMWISQLIFQGLTSISPILGKKYSVTRNYLVSLLIDSTLQLLANYLKKKQVKINRFDALQLFIDIHSIIEWGYTYKYTKGTNLNSFKRLEAIIDLYIMNPKDVFEKSPLTDADVFMENKSFKYQDEFMREYSKFPDILRTLTLKNIPLIEEIISSKTEKKTKQKHK